MTDPLDRAAPETGRLSSEAPESVLLDPGPDGVTPDDVQPGAPAGDAIAQEAPGAVEEIEREIEQAAVRTGPSAAVTWGMVAVGVLIAVLAIVSL